MGDHTSQAGCCRLPTFVLVLVPLRVNQMTSTLNGDVNPWVRFATLRRVRVDQCLGDRTGCRVTSFRAWYCFECFEWRWDTMASVYEIEWWDAFGEGSATRRAERFSIGSVSTSLHDALMEANMTSKRTLLGGASVATALVALLLGYSVYRSNAVAQAQQLRGPSEWVPFTADVRVVHRHGNDPETHGRFFRAADGSNRTDSYAPDRSWFVAAIHNMAAKVTYLRSGDGSWSSLPFGPHHRVRPLEVLPAIRGFRTTRKARMV